MCSSPALHSRLQDSKTESATVWYRTGSVRYGTVRYRTVPYVTVWKGPAADTNLTAGCYLLSNDSHVNKALNLSFSLLGPGRVAGSPK
jgi:hypothetical protein